MDASQVIEVGIREVGQKIPVIGSFVGIGLDIFKGFSAIFSGGGPSYATRLIRKSSANVQKWYAAGAPISYRDVAPLYGQSVPPNFNPGDYDVRQEERDGIYHDYGSPPFSPGNPLYDAVYGTLINTTICTKRGQCRDIKAGAAAQITRSEIMGNNVPWLKAQLGQTDSPKNPNAAVGLGIGALGAALLFL